MVNVSTSFDAIWRDYQRGDIGPIGFLKRTEVSQFAGWAEAKIALPSLKKLAEDLAPIDRKASGKIFALFLKVKAADKFTEAWNEAKANRFGPLEELLKKSPENLEQFFEWSHDHLLTEGELTPLIFVSHLLGLANDRDLGSQLLKLLQFKRAIIDFPQDQKARLSRYYWPLLKDFNNTFMIKNLIKALTDIAPDQIKTTLEHIISLIRYHVNPYILGDTLDIIKGIAPERRADVLKEVAPLLRDEDFLMHGGEHSLQRILLIVKNVPTAQIALVTEKIVNYLRDFTYPHFRIQLLDCLRDTPQEQIVDLLNQALSLVPAHVTDGTRVEIVEALLELASDQRANIIRLSGPILNSSQDAAERLATIRAFIGIDEGHIEPFATRLVTIVNGGRNVFPIVGFLNELDRLEAPARAALIIHGRHTDIVTLVRIIRELNQSMWYAGSGPSYELFVVRSELENSPTLLLNTLCGHFSRSVRNALAISYATEPGIDAGGLGRQFISDLFSGVLKAVGCPKDLDSGLYRPKLEEPDAEKQKIYRQLGQVMMFCLNATRDYPIGVLFDDSLFIALKEFREADLECDFNDLLESQELFRVYEAINSPQKMDTIKRHLFMAEGWAQFAEDYLRPELLPLFELAKGMRASPFANKLSWQQVRLMEPSALSKQLQGTLSRPELVQKLQFDARIPQEKRQWLQHWIEAADNEKIKQFLYTVTGASSIGNLQIKIHDNSPIDPIEEPPLYFHTCFNAVDIPFAKIGSEEQFKTIFEGTLGGTKKYNRS